MADQHAVESKLVNWTDRNIVSGTMLAKEFLYGGGFWPGDFWAIVEFDWKTIGFEENGQIRLIVSNIKTVNDGYADGIKSVFFGNRSGYGFVVKPIGSADLGVGEEYLTYLSERLAVVCRERD